MTKHKLLDRIMVLEQRVDALQARLARGPSWDWLQSAPSGGPHTVPTLFPGNGRDRRWTNIGCAP
jgi:hypothetical protein